MSAARHARPFAACRSDHSVAIGRQAGYGVPISHRALASVLTAISISAGV